MDLHTPIGQYMARKPIVIAQEAEVTEALALMTEHDIRHLPVVDGQRLVGLVSERDLALIETLLPDSWSSIAVAEAMSTEPYAVAADTPVGEVARIMAERKYGSAVIVDADGLVTGIFTGVDALRALADACGLQVAR